MVNFPVGLIEEPRYERKTVFPRPIWFRIKMYTNFWSLDSFYTCKTKLLRL